jgi:2,5-diamino-6-(ribosylamino)-4(3H)-pyrimidinone 5'-phosphate reductase
MLSAMGLCVILNFALSADGKISTSGNSAAHFTSKEDLIRLHEIRKKADALLVGRGTLEADQMTLTTKGNEDLRRCVISHSGNFDFEHPLFHSKGGPIHLISSVLLKSTPAGVTSHCSSLDDWLLELDGDSKVQTLLCEGGGALAHSLLKLDRVDEIHLTLASHSLFGGKNAPSLTGKTPQFLPETRKFDLISMKDAGSNEFFLHYQRIS